MVISNVDYENERYIMSCADMAKRMAGRLHIRLEKPVSDWNEYFEQRTFVAALKRLSYVSQTIEFDHSNLFLMQEFPKMLFHYKHYPTIHQHLVYYRPALLNGRHVVDVLRAVCGPADVSEAELERVRRHATQWARSYLGVGCEAVWKTSWGGVAVA